MATNSSSSGWNSTMSCSRAKPVSMASRALLATCAVAMVWKIGCRNGKTSPGVAVLAASAAARPANSCCRRRPGSGPRRPRPGRRSFPAPARGARHASGTRSRRRAPCPARRRRWGSARGLRGALELLDRGFQHVPLAGGAGFDHLLQVGAHGEGSRMPDDQAVELALGAATACRMPSSTSAPSVWFLEMTDRMATPGSTSGRFQGARLRFPRR